MISDITGVVLAGGKSLRMKTDKALLKFNDKTLIEKQVDLLSSVFKSVVISANSDKYAFLNKRIIADNKKSKGPIGGILSILNNIETEYIFVLSVDMPTINKNLINYIIDRKENYDIIIPTHKGKLEPTCAIYSKNCIDIIENQIYNNNNKLIDLINLCNARLIDISKDLDFYNDKLFLNLNSQNDVFNNKDLRTKL